MKCIELLNHYVVYQELTECCRSTILQIQTNKFIEKRSDFWLPETGARERGNWTIAIKKYKVPVISKY